MPNTPVFSQELVQSTLDDFVAAWNRGDLEAACAVYAEDASFISEGKYVRGKALILDSYRKAYPDPSSMGTLLLEILEFRCVSSGCHADSMASALLRWTVRVRGGKTTSGYALEVYEFRSGAVRLMQDATM